MNIDQSKALEEGLGTIHNAQKSVEVTKAETASTAVASSPTLGSSESIFGNSFVFT